jgi:uncharacterized protein with HEPN domain
LLSSKAQSWLRDIYESIIQIEEFVRGMDPDSYRVDEKTQAAVERKILIISEAAIRLGEEAEVICPGLPWRDIRGCATSMTVSPRKSYGTRSQTIFLH